MEDEYFKGIGKIKYEGPESKNVLAYKYYNPEEVILGKKMKDWLRFAVAYWHTFRGTGQDMFGSETIKRPWDDGSNSLENAKRRMRANFEFLSKLGVRFSSSSFFLLFLTTSFRLNTILSTTVTLHQKEKHWKRPTETWMRL